MLLLACGPASAQFVKVVNWANTPRPAQANPVNTITGIDLDDSTTVYVVGMYVDGAGGAGNLYSAVTFGGVPATGFMNNPANTRSAIAYWINPNTAAGQTLSFNYANNGSFQGFAWRYELSNVDTNAGKIVTSGALQAGFSTSLTTLTNNSFVISYIGANNDSSFTVNPPLTQTATTQPSGGTGGASMASATNTIATPGLVNISWNLTGAAVAQQSVGAIAFIPADLGTPIVAGSVSPALTAPGAGFMVTVTIDPFHFGTVTNVSVDLSSIGGPSANALVQSSDPNVWTNSFIVPGGAPKGTSDLLVTVKQDAAPITGTGSVPINIADPSVPQLVKDTTPATPFSMYVGQGVTFSATFAAPGIITYQWQKGPDGNNNTYTNIPGAAGTTYTIPSAALSDAGYYRLRATNFLGSVESTGTQVTVVNSATALYLWSETIPFAGLTAEQILTNFPANNKIAGALRAQDGGNPVSVILTNAGNRPVVFAAANTSWASLAGGAAFVSNVNTNQTRNSTFNSVLNGGYNSNTTHTITMSGLVVGQQYQVQLFALDNRPGLTPEGSLQLTSFTDPADPNGITSQPFAMADNVYMLGRFTAKSTEMTIQQNLGSDAGNFNCLVLRTVGWDPPPYFTLQPKNTNNFAGTRVSLTGGAAGDSTIASPTITYQWGAGPVGGPYTNLVEGIKYAGVTTTTLIVSNLVASDGNLGYVLKASNGGGTATSREARIYVQSQPPAPPANSFAGAVLALTNLPNTRLAGLWQLNEIEDPSTGVVLAQDASGRGRHGTYGTTSQNKFNGVLSPQPPQYGGFAANQGALQTGTAGTGDSNSVVSLPPLNLTNAVATTICMWIYPTATAAQYGGLFWNRALADDSGFGFGTATGGPSNQRALGFTWNSTPSYATFGYNSGLFPVNDQWNFVVFVLSTNAATFYLNYVDQNGAAFFGKAADTTATYTQNRWTGSPIWIGGDPGNSGTTIFPGRIANVAVFNSALTDDQIYDLFVAGFQTAGFPASILQHPPENTTTFAGYTLQLSTVPGGSKPITNQWKFNGVNLVDGPSNGSIIVGSKSNVLTIQNVTTNWQGVFTLAVTNLLGGAVSSNANVVIRTPVPPPAGNLVGNWFDGTTSLADHSGRLPGTHNAYGVGASATNYVFTNNVPPGKSGSSLSLFGGTSMGISNSTINDVGYVNTFDDGIATSFTVMTWARGQPAASNPFVSKNGQTEGWQLRRSAGANAVFTMQGTGGTVDPTGTAGGSGADGAWHHYAGTYDSATGTRTLYVDGIVQNVTTGDGPYLLSPGSRLVLGGRSTPPNADITGTANFTGGMLYDVRIYNTAITDVQVAYVAAPPALSALPPTLSAVKQGANLTISWNADAAGYSLVSSPTISASEPWTNVVPGTPNPITGAGSVNVSTTTPNTLFYRLRK